MPSLVCRLKYRKGEPLGLSLYPATTFCSLPFEIHNQIYEQLLVASKHIRVCSALESGETPSAAFQKAKLRGVTVGLLSVNKTIALEAARIFYRSNTFSFTGSDTWDALYFFLVAIGATNRAYIQRLEAGIFKPVELRRYADGTLTGYADRITGIERVYARDSYPRIYSPYLLDWFGGIECALVDYISPAIEAVFRVLGPNGPPLTLTLKMDFEFLPGEQMVVDSQQPDANAWSLEVPNHVERMGREFTAREGEVSRVKVLWKGLARKGIFY